MKSEIHKRHFPSYAPVLVNLQAALTDFGLNDQLDSSPAGYPPNPIQSEEDCQEQFSGDQLEYERCLCLHFPAEAALQSIECSSFEPVYWYHPDYLGHTDFVTDRTGQPYQHFFYAPFGEALLSQHTGTGYYNTPYRFNAKELDSETGLIYYGARYYEPKESVWLSVDPLAGKSPHQSSFHFVSNNPVMRIDPDGREDGWYIDESGNVIGRDKNLFDDRIYFVYGSDVDKVKADNFENGVSQASLSNPIELPTLEERNRLKMVYQYGLEDRNQEFGMITEKSESGKIASRLYRSSQPFKRNSQGGSGSISFLPSEIISSEGYTNEYTLENWHFSVLAHTHNINDSRQPPTPHSDKLPANFNVGIVFDYYSGGHNTYIFNHSTKFRSKSRMNTNSFFSPFITPDGKAL